MKVFFSCFLIIIGCNARAQTFASTTEADTTVCLTCANSTGFIPMSSEQLRQLDQVMSGQKKQEPIVFDLFTTKNPSQLTVVPKETTQEKNNRVYRPPLRNNASATETNNPKKLELMYVLDPAESSILNFGLNRNNETNDPSTITKQKKNRKILGLKYRKKF